MTEEHEPQDQLPSPLNDAVQSALAEPISREAIERVKRRAKQLARAPVSPAPQTRTSSPRRWIAAAVAAGLLLAIAIGPAWRQPQGQLLAQAAEKAVQAKSARMAFSTRFGTQPAMEGQLFLDGQRMRLELFEGTLVQIADFENKKLLTLDTKQKQSQSQAMNENFPVVHPVDQLRKVGAGAATSLGEEAIQGRKCQIYQTNTFDLLGIRGKGEMLVWVDLESGLPARITIRDPDPKAELEIRFDNIVWKETLDAALFSLTSPAGYKEATIVKGAGKATATPVSALDSPEVGATGVLSKDRAVAAIVWAPDGSTVTALVRDAESTLNQNRQSNELRQWERATGKLRWRQAVAGANQVAFDPLGNRLAVGIGREIQLRDANTGSITKTLVAERQVAALAFAPDGKTLAVGIAVWGRNGTSVAGGGELRDVESGRLLNTLPGEKPTAWIAFNPDGKSVALTTNEGPINLFAVDTGKLIRVFPGAFRASFAPDGKTLAVVSNSKRSDNNQGIVEIFETMTGAQVHRLTNTGASPSTILGLAFSADGKRLVATDWNRSVSAWTVATQQAFAIPVQHQGGVLSAAFSPDGKTLATGSEDLTLKLTEINP